MLPVVRGEAETRRQILLYSVLLYAVTQLPFCAGGFGTIYLVASLVLGLGFIVGARAPAAPRRPALGAAPVPLLAGLPGAAVLRDGRRRAPVGCAARHDDPPPRTQEHPHRPDRGRRSACSCSASRSWSRRSTSREPARARGPARRRGDPPPGPVDPAGADGARHHAHAGRADDVHRAVGHRRRC